MRGSGLGDWDGLRRAMICAVRARTAERSRGARGSIPTAPARPILSFGPLEHAEGAARSGGAIYFTSIPTSVAPARPSRRSTVLELRSTDSSAVNGGRGRARPTVKGNHCAPASAPRSGRESGFTSVHAPCASFDPLGCVGNSNDPQLEIVLQRTDEVRRIKIESCAESKNEANKLFIATLLAPHMTGRGRAIRKNDDFRVVETTILQKVTGKFSN